MAQFTQPLFIGQTFPRSPQSKVKPSQKQDNATRTMYFQGLSAFSIMVMPPGQSLFQMVASLANLLVACSHIFLLLAHILMVLYEIVVSVLNVFLSVGHMVLKFLYETVKLVLLSFVLPAGNIVVTYSKIIIGSIVRIIIIRPLAIIGSISQYLDRNPKLVYTICDMCTSIGNAICFTLRVLIVCITFVVVFVVVAVIEEFKRIQEYKKSTPFWEL